MDGEIFETIKRRAEAGSVARKGKRAGVVTDTGSARRCCGWPCRVHWRDQPENISMSMIASPHGPLGSRTFFARYRHHALVK